MKKTKAARGAKCTSTTSSLKCVLEGDHDVHSTTAKSKGQRATWKLSDDGRFEVKTFSSTGKVMAQWFDDAPPRAAPKPKTCLQCGGNQCKTGDCLYALTPTAKAEVDIHSADKCTKCGFEMGEHDGKKCPPKHGDRPSGKLQAAADRMTKRDRKLDAATVTTTQVEAVQPAKVTKIGEHDVHPAASLFPMIGENEWPAFVADIRETGQRKKIVRIDMGGSWSILDGRNRLKACLEVGVQPKFRVFGDEPGDGKDPIAFVVSENVQRRHLNETQRAFVGAELVPMYEAQAKERMLAGQVDPGSNKSQGRSAELAARAVNVSRSSVESALKVNRDGAPEVIAAAKDRGQIKVSTAAKLTDLPKAKQQEIVAKVGGGELRSGKVRSLINQENKRSVIRDINDGLVPAMPQGPFGVIYGDYAWLFENSDQHEGSRGHMGYPPMALDQEQLERVRAKGIAVSDVTILEHARDARTRAGESCILALWTTNWHIIKQMPQVLEAYGAEHRTVITWPKQKAGVGTWPRGRTEHLVIASIGEPVHTLNEITTLLESYASREHSRKPDEVAELLLKHCSGPHLELFGREPREGWIVWGAETEKFATEAA